MMTSAAVEIARRIDESGPITFAEFMDLALYGEGGYYASDQPRIGREGDFVTGSRLRLFARATDRILRRLDRLLGTEATLLEIGFGDARHLRHLVEVGRGSLYAHDRVRRPLPPSVTWVQRPEPRSVTGMILTYELFDALPVHRLVWRGGELRELWVGRGTGDRPFCWLEDSLSDPGLSELITGLELVDGQIVDLSPAWISTYGRLAAALKVGLLATFDYGFPRARLADPRVRMHGTLACYRAHTVHRDPLVNVGSQDLSAHVDFTALRESGEAAGLRTLGEFKLAEWMTALGVFNDLESADLSTRLEAGTLLDPEGMGSDIKLLLQARGELDLPQLQFAVNV